MTAEVGTDEVASWEREETFSRLFDPYTRKLRIPLPYDSKRRRPALWDISSGCILWLPSKETISPDILLKSNELAGGHPKMFHHPVLVLDVKVTAPEDAVVTFLFMRSEKNRKKTEPESLGLSSSYYFHIHHFSMDEGPSESTTRNETTGAKLRTKAMGDPNVATVDIKPEKGDTQDVGITKPTYATPARSERGKKGLLYLEKETSGRSMTKKSFVDDSKAYTIEWQELRCYAKSQKPDGCRHRLRQESYNKVAERLMRRGIISRIPEWVETGIVWETFLKKHIPSSKTSKSHAPESSQEPDADGWMIVKRRSRT